ncbi:hypothetical protein SAMN05216464_11365 [Mucilaginibacter pineti]|uniref:Uncharacterized protein n=1 Tax=Mucilaginibacter pineti TaxID=1391627 RepID=A0A1G7ILI0_9SPHI|nr:hypothetical protein [Mucilaginibacter pineti]SDF13149.1 hypothetical protein SAMN05216464_11365 [Mucilaginibacter pineti]
MTTLPQELEVETVPRPKALIIDDAFDNVHLYEVSLNNFKEYYQEKETDLVPVLESLGLPSPEENFWDDDEEQLLGYLNKLWENINDRPLREVVRHPKLFATKLERLEDLESVCLNIESQEIDIEKLPSTHDFSDLTIIAENKFVYIFIDYNLGVTPGDAAVNKAKEVARLIYDKCEDQDQKPMTILMSSDSSVKELKDEFKKDSGLVEGVFRFTPKTDLKDKSKITLLARAYAEEFFCNHMLQDYIQSLIAAAAKAQEDFATGVRMLMVEDYAFIQDSILQDQQQPLGDYLAWLYGSYWTHLLVTNQPLKEKQEKIDQIISKKKPLHHSLPTPELSDIFMKALYETELGELKQHPWVGIEAGVASLPFLHLGDIFTKPNEKSVFMVLNPQCDLERPDCKSNDLSILLLPGKLEVLDTISQKDAKTDFFVFEGNSYRINWNFKQFITVPLQGIESWIKQTGFERNLRLKEPFVLDIQQQFSSHISRVGLPVSPPFSTNVIIRVRYKNFDSTVNDDFIPRSDKFAFLPITRKKENIRFTLNFALEFKSALVAEVAVLTKILKAETDEKTIANIKAILEAIENFIPAYDKWFFDNRAIPYPEANKIKPLRNKVLAVTLDSKAEYSAQVPFMLDIITQSAAAIEIEAEVIPEKAMQPAEINVRAIESHEVAPSLDVLTDKITDGDVEVTQALVAGIASSEPSKSQDLNEMDAEPKQDNSHSEKNSSNK